MKKKRCLLVLILTMGSFFVSPLSADITESFVVGNPFDSDSGLNPGDQTSSTSTFASSPTTGIVAAINPRSILEGNGDVEFTAYTGTTRVEFDMGTDLTTSNLIGAIFLDSEISLTGIDATTTFTFDFRATFLDGTVSNITDLDVTATNGSLVIVNNEGLFETVLTPTGGSSDITFSSLTGSPIRSVQFRNIWPEVATDELLITGSRTLSIVGVPEPQGLVFIGTMGLLFAVRRRRNVA